MAGQNLSPKAQDRKPTAHAYDTPGLSSKGFLLAVMHDPTVDMRDRIKAASALLKLFPHDWDPPQLKYIIPHCHSLSTESGPLPTSETTEIGSQVLEPSHIALSHSREATVPVNLTRYPDPPSPEEIQKIKAAVQRLHPDADLSHIPDKFTLCECGFWMPFPCRCASIH